MDTTMTKTKTYPLRLPRSLNKAVEQQSKEDGTSINQFMATAVAEKLSALQTAEFFASRKARADFKVFDKLMSRRGGKRPRAGDELPPLEFCANLSYPLKPCSFSENSAQLEKPFAMAGVADATANEEGAERGLGQEASGNIVGELAASGHTIHLSDLVGSDGINLLAQKGRKDKQVTQESRAK